MLVRITRQPSETSVDGILLSAFKVGLVYSLPVSLATLMISESWAVPVLDSEDVTLPPIKLRVFAPPERRRRLLTDRRLRVELGVAADRRQRKRRR
jgi:hypothetical protein